MLLKSNYMYDPLVKVPLIVKFPGYKRKGTRSAELVNNIDLAPTIVKQAGCEPGSFMSGNDLAESESGSARQYVFCEHGRGAQYMIRSKTRKLIRCADQSKSVFIDLKNDPLEFANLIDQPEYQEEIRQYSQALSDLVLFEAPAPDLLDVNAPVIAQENVPIKDGKLVDEMRDWIRGQMQEK